MQIPENFQSKKIKIIGLAVLFILTVAGSLYAVFGPKKPAPSQGQILSQSPKQVEEFVVGYKNITFLKYLGTVDSDTALDITAQTAGTIISIDAQAGQTYPRSKLIATLGTATGQIHQSALGVTTAQQQLAAARKGLDNAKISSDLLIKQADFGITSSQDAASLAKTQSDLTQASIDNLAATISNLKNQLQQLEALPSPTTEQLAQIESLKSAILSAEIQKNQLESGKIQLEAAANNNPLVEASKRTLELVKSQAKTTIEAAENQVKLAEIGLTSAQILSETANIRMPYLGTLDKILVDLGQTVAPGTPIARVLGTSQAKILIQVPSEVAQKVATDEKVNLSASNKSTTGTIRRVAQIAEKTTKLFEVEIIASENIFQVGEAVNVLLPIKIEVLGKALIVVPLDSIYVSAGNRYVFANVDGRAILKNVKVGQVIGNVIVVTEGLETADKVIVTREIAGGDSVVAKQINE